MAIERYRGSRLDQIAGTTHRRPAFRVVIWNPRLTNVQDVVRSQWSGVNLDVSAWVSDAQISQNQVFENNDDAVSARATVTFEVDDNAGVVVGGFRIKIDHRLFRDGTPIRIYEGDRRIARQDWIPVFTGIVRGNPGADVAQRGQRRVRVQCFGRAQMYQLQQIVGINWPYGTDLGDMAVDVAMIEMGLERDEIRFGVFDYSTRHKANALTQIGKMQGLHEIMRVVGRKPYFDAEGFLVSHDTSLFKPPAFAFTRVQVSSIRRVQQLAQFVNSVEVIGLSDRMTKVENPVKPLAEVNATVGYFDSHYRETIWFSSDHNRRAQNTFISVVHGGGGFLGSDVDWTPIDEFSGRMDIDTGYAPELLSYIVTCWSVLSGLEYFLDLAIDGAGTIPIFGGIAAGTLAVTRFVVQTAKAATMLAYQYIMTQIGRYRVIVYGEPFEYVFQELRAIAALSDVNAADVVERSETMHWLTRIDDVRARAKELLRRELVKTQTYEIEMPSVPALEVDDIIEIDTGGDFGFAHPARFYVISIERSYERPSSAMMTLRAWHCVESKKPIGLSSGAMSGYAVLNP